MTWIDIGELGRFSIGSSTELVVEGRIIAVFNVDGILYAMDGVCPHQGGPVGKGQLDGCIVTCPWHGWQFDVRDGQSQLSPGVRHPTYDTKVDAERVFVDIPDE